MSTWQLSSHAHPPLTVATTVVMVITLSLATVSTACPDGCQCTQTYYAYCQGLGLTSDSVEAVVTSVPSEAILLDLSSNVLERLWAGVLDGLPNLHYLLLDDNLLHTLGAELFRHQQDLKELELTGNKLTSIPGGVFVNMSSLQKLHLEGNGAEQVEAGAFSLPGLQQLFLHNNSLVALGPAQLQGLGRLLMLDLADNFIHTLEPGVFRGLGHLQKLRLSRNQLAALAEDAFEGLASLQDLYLDGNALASLDCFQVSHFSTSLQRLVLSNNSLTTVPSDVFPQFRSLRVLALDHNRVSVVGAQAVRGLQLDELSLAHNMLRTVDRDMLHGTSLISLLDLSHNHIHTIRTGALDSFRESVYVLNMASNRLSRLDHGMFRGMRNLQTLNLSANALSTILQGSFSQLTQLVDLDLDHNQLEQLSASLLEGPVLQRLSVLNNPLTSLSSFTFQDVKHAVHVQVNLTQQSATLTSVTVTWPYRQGAQLFWRLRVWCEKEKQEEEEGGEDGNGGCTEPMIKRSIPPNSQADTVHGLEPGQPYFVCVDPTFLSSLVTVSQCGWVSTLRHAPTTLSPPKDPEGHTAGCAPHTTGQGSAVWGCIVLAFLTAIVLCRDLSLGPRRDTMTPCPRAGKVKATSRVDGNKVKITCGVAPGRGADNAKGDFGTADKVKVSAGDTGEVKVSYGEGADNVTVCGDTGEVKVSCREGADNVTVCGDTGEVKVSRVENTDKVKISGDTDEVKVSYREEDDLIKRYSRAAKVKISEVYKFKVISRAEDDKGHALSGTCGNKVKMTSKDNDEVKLTSWAGKDEGSLTSPAVEKLKTISGNTDKVKVTSWAKAEESILNSQANDKVKMTSGDTEEVRRVPGPEVVTIKVLSGANVSKAKVTSRAADKIKMTSETEANKVKVTSVAKTDKFRMASGSEVNKVKRISGADTNKVKVICGTEVNKINVEYKHTDEVSLTFAVEFNKAKEAYITKAKKMTETSEVNCEVRNTSGGESIKTMVISEGDRVKDTCQVKVMRMEVTSLVMGSSAVLRRCSAVSVR